MAKWPNDHCFIHAVINISSHFDVHNKLFESILWRLEFSGASCAFFRGVRQSYLSLKLRPQIIKINRVVNQVVN